MNIPPLLLHCSNRFRDIALLLVSVHSSYNYKLEIKIFLIFLYIYSSIQLWIFLLKCANEKIVLIYKYR